MTLKPYQKKRPAAKGSPEPSGNVKSKSSGEKDKIFVIQRHDARQLHFDFRLELDGVLKSWAVPKGIPTSPAEKHLAIMVEDHPYEYRTFEGTIPKGSYGAGTVEIWDDGIYYPLDDHHEIITWKEFKEGLKRGKVSFALHGKKLHSRFSLVRLRNAEENQWLLIKGYDIEAEGNSSKDIKSAKDPKVKAPKATMPHDVKPMLAYSVDEPFDDKAWLFEFKWDGFRAIAEIDQSKVNLYSRSHQSFNEKFESICQALKTLKIQAVVDGEVVAVDEKGNLGFQALQNYQRTAQGDLKYCLFDLLYYDGKDLRNLPLEQRKEILRGILAKSESKTLYYSEHLIEKGKTLYKQAEKEGLEGIMAKEKDSLYESSRSKQWLKIKIHTRQEAIICGFTEPRGSRLKLGALILGVYDEKDKLKYIGHVGGGFNRSSLSEIYDELKPLITNKCPFTPEPATNSPVTWVKPKMICEVSFAEWTTGMQMRQPIFQGIRKDKKPKDVKIEQTLKTDEVIDPPQRASKTSKTNLAKLTNLDKVYWPKEGYTKGDLLRFYEQIAPYIIPHLKNRPQSLRRYPNGIEQPGFFQKHASESFPDWIQTTDVTHKSETIKYMLISDLQSLLFAVNLGCIDFNPFCSRIGSLDNPDYMILDIDPENTTFDDVIEVALSIYEVLESIGAASYCKTSGSRGMHIYVPLHAAYTYEQSKQFAQLIAGIVHEKLPKLISLEHSPAKRQKKIHIDYLRNAHGQTAASVYSVRPRPGAPVSTPLDWSEVKRGLDPKDFNIHTVPERLEKKGDLFKPVLGKGVNISRCLKKL